MAEKEEIPRELYKCLAWSKMLMDSCEMKCRTNLSRDAVEQWAKDFYGEEYLEKQIKYFRRKVKLQL